MGLWMKPRNEKFSTLFSEAGSNVVESAAICVIAYPDVDLAIHSRCRSRSGLRRRVLSPPRRSGDLPALGQAVIRWPAQASTGP